MKPIQLRTVDCWVLDEDERVKSKIIKEGTLVIETTIRRLPEYKALPLGGLVVEVGAYIGYITRMLLDDGFKVVAFEPYPDAFACLQKNARDAKTINSPVGYGDNVLLDPDIMRNGNPGTRQTLLGRQQGTPSVRLDEVIGQEDPCFMKLDCEGSEVKVIQGAHDMLNRARPVMWIEVFPAMLYRMGDDIHGLYGCLKALGYQWRVVEGVENSSRWDILATPI